MHEALSVPRPLRIAGMATLTALAGALAVALGTSIGNPTPAGSVLIVATLACAALSLLVLRPFTGFLVLVTSSFLLMGIQVFRGTRNVNAFDPVLPILLVATWFGSARREARASDALEVGPSHDVIRRAASDFARSAAVYFALAALSLVLMAFQLGPGRALDRSLHLWRGMQGALLFPLGLLWLRSERRIRQAWYAVLVGGGLFVVVNGVQLSLKIVQRAGYAWYPARPGWPVDGHSGAGATMVMLVGLILVEHTLRPRARNYLMLGLAVLMLVFSQSRSGLLALAVFIAMSLRRVRRRHLVMAALALAPLLALVPTHYWEHLRRTVILQPGSFEVYTFNYRLYSFQTALKVFLDYWFFGVGYLGYEFVCPRYNHLGANLVTTENMWLETAVGMGVVGLWALIVVFVRLFALGQAVKRVTPPGSRGRALAELHVPLMTGLAAANLTGTNYVALICIAQLSLWCAMLVRAGHLAVSAPPAPEHRE